MRNIQLTVFVAEAVKAFVAVIETLDAFRYYIEASFNAIRHKANGELETAGVSR